MQFARKNQEGIASNSKDLGQRLDRLVRRRFPGLTRRHAREAIDAGLISIPSVRGRKGDRVAEVQTIQFGALEDYLKASDKPVGPSGVRVLFDSDSIVVVDKPRGVPSHPISLFDEKTITQWFFKTYPECAARFKSVQPTVVPHRLDTQTSGVLVVAKSPEVYEEWRLKFQRKEFEKTYLAWCWGNPPSNRFQVNTPLAHHSRQKDRMIAVDPLEKRFRPPVMQAFTEVSVESRYSHQVFLARAVCRTGVTHQVRVHLSLLGFPLVGDKIYDPGFDSRRWNEVGHWLRAVKLESPEYKFTAEEATFASGPPWEQKIQ